MANSPEFVAATKGGKRMMGTNPLAIGIPRSDTYPFTVRMFLKTLKKYSIFWGLHKFCKPSDSDDIAKISLILQQKKKNNWIVLTHIGLAV